MQRTPNQRKHTMKIRLFGAAFVLTLIGVVGASTAHASTHGISGNHAAFPIATCGPGIPTCPQGPQPAPNPCPPPDGTDGNGLVSRCLAASPALPEPTQNADHQKVLPYEMAFPIATCGPGIPTCPQGPQPSPQPCPAPPGGTDGTGGNLHASTLDVTKDRG